MMAPKIALEGQSISALQTVREVCPCESGNGHIATGALGCPLLG
jgi:hypothetical protein